MFTSNSDHSPNPSAPVSEEEALLGYVADLQLHMALQSRNLVPTLNDGAADNSRLAMLHQVQAASEKSASRQWL